MSAPFDHHWNPGPQLLAAYFDGELEGRDEVADVRAQVEAWLETHPEARAEWLKHHQLQKLWQNTTPAEPTASTWNQLRDRIESQRRRPIATPPSKRSWWTAGIVAASIVLFVGLVYGALSSIGSRPERIEQLVVRPPVTPNPALVDDVFPVATASEVTVLLIEGADTSMLAVGTMPMHGTLELAAPGDVRVTYVQPDERDKMRPHVQEAPHRPMIWAKLEAE